MKYPNILLRKRDEYFNEKEINSAMNFEKTIDNLFLPSAELHMSAINHLMK